MKKIVLTIAFVIFLSFFIMPVNSETESIFSIQIIDFQSPVKLGDFLEFSYSTEGILGINDSAEVNFLLEKNGEIITSGSDTIYFGNPKEKIRNAKIFLPTNMESGVYTLKIEAGYNGNMADAYRTIEIDIKKGFARILNIVLILLLVVLIILYISLNMKKGKRRIFLRKKK